MWNDIRHIIADWGLNWFITLTPTKDRETLIKFHEFMLTHCETGLKENANRKN